MTSAFVFLAAAMTLVAVIIVLWPMFRQPVRTGNAATSQQAQDQLFRQHRLQELQNDVDSGILDAEQLENASAEIKRMGEAASAEASTYQPGLSGDESHRRTVMRVAFAVVLIMPLSSAALYWQYNGWPSEAELAASRAMPSANQETPSVEQMVSGLANRLEQNPDDLEGWIMLGRSYRVMNRFAEATKAYRKANELSGGDNADILVAEAATLGLSRDRDLLGRPQQLFAQALKLQPDNLAANWYSGLIGLQENDANKAIQYFEKALSLDPPPDFRKAIVDQLNFARQQVGLPAQASKQTQSAGTAQTGPRLSISVDASPDIKAEFDASTRVFVFARVPNGPHMPLAVQRLAVSDLPAQVILDDSMAMMPSMKLSAHQRWEIVARISRSGQPVSQPGDAMVTQVIDAKDASTPIMLSITELLK